MLQLVLREMIQVALSCIVEFLLIIFILSTSPPPHSQMFMGNRMAELLRDKEGVTISDQLDFGSVMVGETKLLHVWIR